MAADLLRLARTRGGPPATAPTRRCPAAPRARARPAPVAPRSRRRPRTTCARREDAPSSRWTPRQRERAVLGALRARNRGLTPASQPTVPTRDRRPALRLFQHDPDTHARDLPKARGYLARRSGRPRARTRPALARRSRLRPDGRRRGTAEDHPG